MGRGRTDLKPPTPSKPKPPMDPISREVRKYERRLTNVQKKVSDEGARHRAAMTELNDEMQSKAVLSALRQNQLALEKGKTVLSAKHRAGL